MRNKLFGIFGKSALPTLLAGALLAFTSPVAALAAGHGGGGHGGGGFSGGGHAVSSGARGFSGGGRAYSGGGVYRGGYGGGYYRGGGYYGGGGLYLGLGYGAPYAYGPAYGYAAPAPCGFYDQGGYWHAAPCYNGTLGY